MDVSKLKGHIPDAINDQITDAVTQFNINTPLRLAHFLAQTAHESGGFKVFSENLNYSADGLLKVFPKYFKDKATADKYARKPEMIANRVYASRMGNGDEASGDGWKYRGRGAIQTTGKDNYKSFDLVVPEDILANPDLLATKYILASAGHWWTKNGMNTIADKGATPEVVTSVTKRVNGGTHGLADRQEKFNKFFKLLSA